VSSTLPVRPLPFPAGSCGFSHFHTVTGSDPGNFLSASYPSPRSFSARQPHPHAQMQMHLSWGSASLQRSTESGIRFTPAVARTAGHLPSSGFLTLSTVYSARNHAGLSDTCLVCKPPFDDPPRETDTSPLRSWDSFALGARPALSIRQGAWKTNLLATVFSASTTNTLPGALPPGTSPPVFGGSGQGAVTPYDGCFEVSIAETSAFLVRATHERQPS
jgi:hypothetical protein